MNKLVAEMICDAMPQAHGCVAQAIAEISHIHGMKPSDRGLVIGVCVFRLTEALADMEQLMFEAKNIAGCAGVDRGDLDPHARLKDAIPVRGIKDGQR